MIFAAVLHARTCYTHLSHVRVLQGDEEKRQGVQPIPMMDRDMSSHLPQSQVLHSTSTLTMHLLTPPAPLCAT